MNEKATVLKGSGNFFLLPRNLGVYSVARSSRVNNKVQFNTVNQDCNFAWTVKRVTRGYAYSSVK